MDLIRVNKSEGCLIFWMFEILLGWHSAEKVNRSDTYEWDERRIKISKPSWICIHPWVILTPQQPNLTTIWRRLLFLQIDLFGQSVLNPWSKELQVAPKILKTTGVSTHFQISRTSLDLRLITFCLKNKKKRFTDDDHD